MPHSNRTMTIRPSLQSSFLWSHFQNLYLTLNMHVQAGHNNVVFASWLKDISYKTSLIGLIALPTYIHACTQPNDLINCLYPPSILETAFQNQQAFLDRCILAFHNDIVNSFNAVVLDKVLGQSHTFHAMDTPDGNGEDTNFAQHVAKYLQNLNLSGLLPS